MFMYLSRTSGQHAAATNLFPGADVHATLALERGIRSLCKDVAPDFGQLRYAVLLACHEQNLCPQCTLCRRVHEKRLA